MPTTVKYRPELLPEPDAETQAKLSRERSPEACRWLMHLLKDANDCLTAIDDERATIADMAGNPEISNRKLTDVADTLHFLEGEAHSARENYLGALGFMSHRLDLDFVDGQRYLLFERFERALQVAKDDQWSGYGNDNRHRYRDGYLRAVERLKYTCEREAYRPPDQPKT